MTSGHISLSVIWENRSDLQLSPKVAVYLLQHAFLLLFFLIYPHILVLFSKNYLSHSSLSLFFLFVFFFYPLALPNISKVGCQILNLWSVFLFLNRPWLEVFAEGLNLPFPCLCMQGGCVPRVIKWRAAAFLSAREDVAAGRWRRRMSFLLQHRPAGLETESTPLTPQPQACLDNNQSLCNKVNNAIIGSSVAGL